jgi:hypothetical protein
MPVTLIKEEDVKPMIGMWTDHGSVYGVGAHGRFEFSTSVSSSRSETITEGESSTINASASLMLKGGTISGGWEQTKNVVDAITETLEQGKSKTFSYSC